jgi:AcrR family transcriptional regulator
VPLTKPDAPGVRDRILAAAVEVLRTEGPTKVTQPHVARAAGVRQSHLTYYFPKKTDLMIAVARRSVEQMARDLGDFFAGAGWRDADAPMRERVMRLVSFIVKDRSRTRLMLALLLAAEEEPELRAVMADNARQVRALLARGMGRSASPDADDPEVDLALATLWGLGLQHLLLRGERDDDYTDRLVRALPGLRRAE